MPRCHSAWPLAREWLFCRDDPRAPAERQAYAEAALALGLNLIHSF
jgi:hypothetical protein